MRVGVAVALSGVGGWADFSLTLDTPHPPSAPSPLAEGRRAYDAHSRRVPFIAREVAALSEPRITGHEIPHRRSDVTLGPLRLTVP